MDIEALIAAGLYDPADPEADDRLEFLRYAMGEGASLEDLVGAQRDRNLSSIVADLRIRRGAISARELAARVGLSLQELHEDYRLLGVVIDDDDAPIFDEREVRLIQVLARDRTPFPDGVGDEILRAVGAGLSIIAESAVAAFVGSVEDTLDQAGGMLNRAQVTAATSDIGLELGSMLGLLFRHHLWAAVSRQRAAMVGSVDRLDTRLTVGFVDLVGFTSLTAAMGAADLLAFVREFHSRTVDVVTGQGGRVVKHIGDEIMFSALDPVAGCQIALALVDAFGEDGSQPRGGLAHGRVVARHGDYYGPIVNLAARLTDIAVPGEILAEASVADEPVVVGAALVFEPAGRRMLKGFTDPVEVVSVHRPR